MSALTLQRFRSVPIHTTEGLRVIRLAVVVVGLHRGITLTTIFDGGTVPLVAAAYVVVGLWSAALLWTGWHQAGFGQSMAFADTGIASAAALLTLQLGNPGMTFGYGVLQGAAIVAGCSLPPRRLAGVLAVLVVTLLPSGSAPAELVAYAAVLVALALTAATAHRLLRMAADTIDRRQRMSRVLHDTALQTLNAIAAGSTGVDARELRARAARDAACLRAMVQAGQLDAGTGFAATLATAAADMGALGLRVRVNCDHLPSDVDPRVVAAMTMAAREALNNVHRHARTRQAWLTAACEESRIVVRVVDRGAGCVAGFVPAGRGIRESIIARMQEIGGVAVIESTPGEGTCVELRWPR